MKKEPLVVADSNDKNSYEPLLKDISPNQMNRISVYPNPATDQITFDNEGVQPGDKYQLINSAGVLMKSSVLVSGQVNISDLPKGVYFFKILSSTGAFQSSFVKQ